MAATDEVVVGATGKDYVLEVVDENNLPVNVAGGTFELQGTSPDLPGVEVQVAGAITDGPNGVVTWTGIGGTNYITVVDMDGKSRVTFTFRVKWTDSGTLVDYSPEFTWDYVLPPL